MVVRTARPAGAAPVAAALALPAALGSSAGCIAVRVIARLASRYHRRTGFAHGNWRAVPALRVFCARQQGNRHAPAPSLASFLTPNDSRIGKFMSVPYQPPAMPAFPESLHEVSRVFAPYFTEGRPLDFFAEMLVIDIVGELPQATRGAVEALIGASHGLKAACGDDWKAWVRSQIGASDTFDIAVQDLWLRNRASARASGWEYHPWHYAQNFLDNYFADDSCVDVWEGDALERAKAAIAAARAGH
jgi:hypothetical protein